MKDTLALTPAVSPRRGSAKNARCYITPLDAFVAQSNAAIRFDPTMTATALPLLGERAGVRADVQSLLLAAPAMRPIASPC